MTDTRTISQLEAEGYPSSAGRLLFFNAADRAVGRAFRRRQQ
jgi:hypothetical protein